MARTGRPKKQIDWELVDNLCLIQCSLKEICVALKCDDVTLETAVKREKGMTFSEYFAEKRCNGFKSLRAKSYEMAMNGNTKMMDKLLDNWLGFTKNTTVESNFKVHDLVMKALKENGNI